MEHRKFLRINEATAVSASHTALLLPIADYSLAACHRPHHRLDNQCEARVPKVIAHASWNRAMKGKFARMHKTDRPTPHRRE